MTWPTAPHIAELLATADRSHFTRADGPLRGLKMTADGSDAEVWVPLTDEAVSILQRLRMAHEKAVDDALGYNWRQYDGAAQNAPFAIERQKAWINLYNTLPTASQALDAEWARRDIEERKVA